MYWWGRRLKQLRELVFQTSPSDPSEKRAIYNQGKCHTVTVIFLSLWKCFRCLKEVLIWNWNLEIKVDIYTEITFIPPTSRQRYTELPLHTSLRAQALQTPLLNHGNCKPEIPNQSKYNLQVGTFDSMAILTFRQLRTFEAFIFFRQKTIRYC